MGREAEKSANRVRHAAQREARTDRHDDREEREADHKSAAASPVLTRREWAKGHPPPQRPPKRH
jgi:hypothetical protein